MDLKQFKQRFNEKYPNRTYYAYFNDKLQKIVYFTIVKNNNETSFIDDKTKQQITEYCKNSPNVVNSFIEYVSENGIFTDEQLSDFYDKYLCNQNISLENILKDVDEFSKTSNNSKTIKSAKKTIRGYVYEPETKSSKSIFFMNITLAKDSNKIKYCHIDDNRTEPEYRGFGIHSSGVKFLEAILAKNNILNIKGEVVDYESLDKEMNGLARHYENLGFSIHQTPEGDLKFTKSVDPYSDLEIIQ